MDHTRFAGAASACRGRRRSFCRSVEPDHSRRSLRQELGERGLEFVEVNYSKERLFEDIKGLYGELLNQAGKLQIRELRS